MRTFRVISTVLMIFSMLLFSAQIVRADPPPLPANFYGQIHIQAGDGVPTAGVDYVEAYVPGIAGYVARALITTYLSDLVYTIAIPGDLTDTPGTKEGGATGDPITFMIGSRLVAMGIWYEGTNSHLDLHPPQSVPGGPYTGLVGAAISLTGSANDWGSDAATYAWDLDGDSAYDDASSASTTYTNASTGTYPVGLQVIDAQGGVGTASSMVFVYALGGLSGQVYDGAAHPVTASGIETPYSYNVTYDGSATAPTNAGTYVVVVHIMDGATEVTSITTSLVIAQRAASVIPNAAGKIFGEIDPGLSGTLLGFLVGDNVSATYSRVAGELVAGSPYTISAVLSATGLLSNYNITNNTANFTIAPKAITVTPDPGQTKVFGDADPVFTYTSSEPVSFTGALSRVGGANVGEYAITIGDLSAGSNYAITLVPANFSITPKGITVTADSGQSKVFGASEPTLTYLSSDPAAPFTGALHRIAGENVGTYAIDQGDLSAGTNYTITFVPANFSITPATAVVTLVGLAQTFDGNPRVVTATTVPAGLTVTITYDGDATPPVNADTYAIVATINELNYVGTASGSLVVAQAPSVTTVSGGGSFVYNGLPHPASVSVTGVGGLSLTPAPVYSGACSAAPVNVADTPCTASYTYAGDLNHLGSSDFAVINITPKGLTVTANPSQTKIYGYADPVFAYTPSEAVTFSGALSRVMGDGVGNYAITISSLTAGSNYAITFVPANFSITPRPITVTADIQTKVYGEDDPALTYQVTGSLAYTDSFGGALSRDPGEAVGPYAITQGTLLLSSNYALTYTGDDLTITLRPITITADNKSKIISAGDPPLTYQITSGSLAFTDAIIGALIRDAGEAIGSYAIRQGTVAVNANYNPTFVNGIFEITGVQHSISLQPGWNLVSFAIHPANTAPAAVLSSIVGSFDLVYAWDATGSHSGNGNWLRYDDDPAPTDTLENITEIHGLLDPRHGQQSDQPSGQRNTAYFHHHPLEYRCRRLELDRLSLLCQCGFARCAG